MAPIRYSLAHLSSSFKALIFLMNIAGLFARNQFLKNLGWMGASEIFIRVTRLFCTVILARCLTELEYGHAAIILTAFEFIRVFTRNGISDKIIQAPDEDIEILCQTAYTLNWLVALFLFFVQAAGAFFAALFYKDNSLIFPIVIVGLSYLVYPFSMVQCSLIYRSNKLKVMSIAQLLQVGLGNILSAVMALAGLGIWAVVLPLILTPFAFVLFILSRCDWRPSARICFSKSRQILGFGGNILGVSLLDTFRQNIDYLIVGKMVGIAALGTYYFAFNAGLGISLSLIGAISVSLYSDLCSVQGDKLLLRSRLISNLRTIASIVIPVVFFQVLLAPFYVPIIFGGKWVAAGAVPILSLICLSAIPRPFANAASMYFRAIGRPRVDLLWNFIFSLLLLGSIVKGVEYGVIGVAVAVLVVHFLFQPLYLLFALRVSRHESLGC